MPKESSVGRLKGKFERKIARQNANNNSKLGANNNAEGSNESLAPESGSSGEAVNNFAPGSSNPSPRPNSAPKEYENFNQDEEALGIEGSQEGLNLDEEEGEDGSNVPDEEYSKSTPYETRDNESEHFSFRQGAKSPRRESYYGEEEAEMVSNVVGGQNQLAEGNDNADDDDDDDYNEGRINSDDGPSSPFKLSSDMKTAAGDDTIHFSDNVTEQNSTYTSADFETHDGSLITDLIDAVESDWSKSSAVANTMTPDAALSAGSVDGVLRNGSSRGSKRDATDADLSRGSTRRSERDAVDADFSRGSTRRSLVVGFEEQGSSRASQKDAMDEDLSRGSDDVGKVEQIQADAQGEVPAYFSGDDPKKHSFLEEELLTEAIYEEEAFEAATAKASMDSKICAPLPMPELPPRGSALANSQLPPSTDCRCTMASNCGQCEGSAGEPGRVTKCSLPAQPRRDTAEIMGYATEGVAGTFSSMSLEDDFKNLKKIPDGSRRTLESGDSVSKSPPPGSQPSESMTEGLDHLPDCDCKAPLLKRIRQLSNRVRSQYQSQEEMRIKRDCAVNHSQMLKDELMKWSQASSYFEHERIKFDSQLHRVEFEKERASEKEKEKDEILEAMKTRLKKREEDFKTEVDNEKALRLELTHAEARVRLVEGWAQDAKQKAEQDRIAKDEADRERAKAFERAEKLEVDLIELRALHANDTTARRLQTEKEFIQIKLNSTQDELRAITAEYKRIFESNNAKPRYQDLADRVRELLKENATVSSQLEHLKCQANAQINDLHRDKNNVNAELHGVTRELAQIKLTDADLRAANGILKQEMGVMKRDTTDLRSALGEEKKLRAEENFKHKLTVDQMRDLLTRARQEIVALKAKMSGVMGKADHLQELASKRARDYVELQSENERKLLECSSTMIHSTEELHGQMELLKVALLKKAEELQILKETHEKCPGVGSVSLKPISVRLGADGKYESVDKMFSQAELDEVIDALETKLNSITEDNERLKEIIKGYDCCCADTANEEIENVKQELEKSDLERQYLLQLAQHLVQSKDFLASGLNSAIEDRFGGLLGTDADWFIERINGVKRICRPFEMEEVRQRLNDMGVPTSILDTVIDEEDDDSAFENPEADLDDLFELLTKNSLPEDEKKQIERLSAELRHYKALEDRLSQSEDVEHGIAKNVVQMVKADVIESLDEPIEVLSEFKTFLWQHESNFDEEAYKTNRDLTKAIREDLERETGELHKMLQQLKSKLLDLRQSGLVGAGRGGGGNAEDAELRRRSELVKKLANGDLSEEEKQRALEELGLEKLSDGALQKFLDNQKLLDNKEDVIMAINSTDDEAGIKVDYDRNSGQTSSALDYMKQLLADADDYTKEQLKKMMAEGASPDDIAAKMRKLHMDQANVDAFVESEAKKMMEEVKRRWEAGDITEDQAKDLRKTLVDSPLSAEEKRALHEKLNDGKITAEEKKEVLKALAGDDRAELHKMLQQENPAILKRQERLTDTAKLSGIMHDDKLSVEKRSRLKADLADIHKDETLTHEQKKEKIKELLDNHIKDERQRSIDSIMNDNTLSEEEKQAKVAKLMDQHVHDAHERAKEAIMNDMTLTDSEKDLKLLAMKEHNSRRGTIDLMDLSGSLTSSERVRLQERLDDDWVLTDEERKKMNAKLDAEKEKKAARQSVDDDNNERQTVNKPPGDEDEANKSGFSVSWPRDTIKEDVIETIADGTRAANSMLNQVTTVREDSGQDGKKTSGIAGDSRKTGGSGSGSEDGKRAGGSSERNERRRGNSIHDRIRGKMGIAQNWIGYFNNLAGILPNPDEVCHDVQVADKNVNSNRGIKEQKQTKVKGFREQERRERENERWRFNEQEQRRQYDLEREVRELDQHPMVQRLRNRQNERRSKNKNAEEEENSASSSAPSLIEDLKNSSKSQNHTPSRRVVPMEERIAELKRQISAYSDMEQTAERKRTERRTARKEARRN